MWLLLACTGPPDPAPVVRSTATVVVQAPPADPVPDTIALRHILISWDGKRLSNKAPRTQEQALDLTEDIHQRLQSGEDFQALAKEYSDDSGSAARMGWLGAGQRETWVPEFSEAAFQLQVGDISPPTESPFGYHIIQRAPMDELHLKQILVQHAGVPLTWRNDKTQSKTRVQAQAQAQAALDALNAGQNFGQVAKEFSDGPMALHGGDLGLFLEGELGPAIDTVALDLEVGARSEIFETNAGLHILERAP
jgi:parvulin-like peptidyl-prolyl isomerase